jgi:ketosteroid isomerase-like protein
MNKIVIALGLSVLSAGSALASDKDDVMGVLKQWISGEAGTVATCAEDGAVIDDIPPFEWHGPGACSRWQKDNEAYLKKQGISDEIFAIANPQQLIISGDRAYAVLPTTYVFTQKGKRVRVTATSTLVLNKTAAGWRITAWTWATQTVQ